MKKLIFLLLVFAGFMACENEIIEELPQEVSKTEGISAKQNQKIDVCHKGNIINVSVNALETHIAHGDAVDRDGDGYFDLDNPCSERDCDDESYSEDNTCDVIFKSKHTPIGWQYVVSGTSDNFETFDITVCSDFGESGCALSSPRLTQVGNVSTYDGGSQLGTIKLIFIGYDNGTTNPIYDIETLAYPSWNNVYFAKRSTYSASCFDCESMYPF